MTLNKFLLKFLPDYKEKNNDAMYNGMVNAKLSYHEQMRWNEKYFPEAIQNFADKICEKQRGNCADAYFKQEDGNSLYDEILSKNGNEIIFLNAKQPKIDEL